MRIKIILICCVSLILFSCNSSTQKNRNRNLVDTVKKDIPISILNDTARRNRNERFLKELGIPSIEQGSDGTVIRIWIGCEFTDTNLVINFKKKDGDWEGNFTFFADTSNSDGNIWLIKVKSELRKPGSGWQSFGEALLNTGITELPHYNKFGKGYGISAGGGNVSVEIATDTLYRFYSYPDIVANRRFTEGPGKLLQALVLIEKEFDLNVKCF